MNNVFYLVSNSSRAQIFEQKKVNGPFVEVTALEHKESRFRNLEISTDKPGRSHHRTRDGKRGAMEPKTRALHPRGGRAQCLCFQGLIHV